jgi:hypothetical protein
MDAGALLVYSSGPAIVAPHRTLGVVLWFYCKCCHCIFSCGVPPHSGQGSALPFFGHCVYIRGFFKIIVIVHSNVYYWPQEVSWLWILISGSVFSYDLFFYSVDVALGNPFGNGILLIL